METFISESMLVVGGILSIGAVQALTIAGAVTLYRKLFPKIVRVER